MQHLQVQNDKATKYMNRLWESGGGPTIYTFTVYVLCILSSDDISSIFGAMVLFSIKTSSYGNSAFMEHTIRTVHMGIYGKGRVLSVIL